MVKRMCGISSWEKEHQSTNQSIDQLFSQSSQSVNESEAHLIHRVNSRQLPVHGNSKHLRHQMCPEQVCDGLVVLEVSRADPDLCQQPVILTVSGQEDRVVFTWSLSKLEKTKGEQEKEEKWIYAECRLEKEMFHLWCNTHLLLLNITVPVWLWAGSCSELSCRADRSELPGTAVCMGLCSSDGCHLTPRSLLCRCYLPGARTLKVSGRIKERHNFVLMHI